MMHRYSITNAVTEEVLGEFYTFCRLRSVWNLLVQLYDNGEGIFAKEVI